MCVCVCVYFYKTFVVMRVERIWVLYVTIFSLYAGKNWRPFALHCILACLDIAERDWNETFIKFFSLNRRIWNFHIFKIPFAFSGPYKCKHVFISCSPLTSFCDKITNSSSHLSLHFPGTTFENEPCSFQFCSSIYGFMSWNTVTSTLLLMLEI
jgi:hypothetical protein